MSDCVAREHYEKAIAERDATVRECAALLELVRQAAPEIRLDYAILVEPSERMERLKRWLDRANVALGNGGGVE